MPRVPVWHRGRMVLVGDSAHAPSSSSGQGASLAIESAIVLARCLRDLPYDQALVGVRDPPPPARRAGHHARPPGRTAAKTAGPVGRVLFALAMTDLHQAGQSRRRWPGCSTTASTGTPPSPPPCKPPDSGTSKGLRHPGEGPSSCRRRGTGANRSWTLPAPGRRIRYAGQRAGQDGETPMSATQRFRIAAIPADGLGLEVVARRAGGARRAGRRQRRCVRVRLAGIGRGLRVLRPHRPDDGRGRPGGPEGFRRHLLRRRRLAGVPDHISLAGLRLAICQNFDQWADVCPGRVLAGRAEPAAQGRRHRARLGRCR